jgi:hypothetical protein
LSSWPRKGGPIITRTLHSKAPGNTIEREQDPGVADGEQVEIIIRTMPANKMRGLYGIVRGRLPTSGLKRTTVCGGGKSTETAIRYPHWRFSEKARVMCQRFSEP